MTRHPNTLDAAQTALLVVDVQDAFVPAIAELETIAARIAKMVLAAKLLELPVLVTEQVPQKLGRTVKAILDVLPESTRIIDKSAFSCCGASAFNEQLRATGVRQVLLCGIETHVCINQTAHDLLAGGYQVHLLTDCVTSRSASDRELGLRKMAASGVLPTSTEMAVFELLRDSTHPNFRAVQKLIK